MDKSLGKNEKYVKIREKIREIREKIRGQKNMPKIRQIRQNTSNTWTPKSNTAKYEKYEDPGQTGLLMMPTRHHQHADADSASCRLADADMQMPTRHHQHATSST